MKSVKPYWIYFIVPSILLGGIKPAFSQMMPGQVITQTVGNQGSVTTERSFMETDTEQIFSFSLSTEDKRIRKKDKKKTGNKNRKGKRRNRKGQRITQKNGINTQVVIRTSSDITVGASSFVLESGRRTEVTRVKIYDTYDYVDSTFNQTLSIDY